MISATLSRESPGLRSPRSRAVILNACRRVVTRRLASPQRSVSLTISRKGRPARRDSALSLAATSSSRVSVVRMCKMLLPGHHDVNELREDIWHPFKESLEAFKANRKGQHSIRINDQ